MNAASYTYINLEKDGKRAWSAVPTTTVAVGDEIELMTGITMAKFTSKSLNRTFNSIYFAGGLKVSSEKTAAQPEGQSKVPASNIKTDATQPAVQTHAPAAESL